MNPRVQRDLQTVAGMSMGKLYPVGWPDRYVQSLAIAALDLDERLTRIENALRSATATED